MNVTRILHTGLLTQLPTAYVCDFAQLVYTAIVMDNGDIEGCILKYAQMVY